MQPAALVLAAAAAFALPALADNLPLPKASYSADAVFESNGHSYTGRINVDGYKERRDLKDAHGVGSVKIIRRDLGKLFELRPKRQSALELRIAAAEAAGETGAPGSDIDTFYGADATPQGNETIAGLPTTKYHVATETSPGLKIDAFIWSTDDGIIVRVVGKASVEGGDQAAQVELTNVARGAQDPSLFEVPQDMKVISPDAPPDGPDAANQPDGTPAKPPSGKN